MQIRHVARLAAVIAVLSGAGCAEFTHLTRMRNFEPQDGTATAAFIDAKQRAVIAVPRVTWTYALKPDGSYMAVEASRSLAVCAEPSPDALSAISAAQTLSGSNGKLSVQEAGSLAEAAGSIGLRTQTIQTMRDAMYRICEGYLSGELSPDAAEALQRHLISSLVANLAIEQLTGAVAANQLALNGSAGTGGDAASLLKLTDEKNNAAKDLDAAKKDETAAKARVTQDQADLATAQKANDQAGIDKANAALKTDQPAADDATSKVASAQDAYDTLKTSLQSAQSGITHASTSAQSVANASNPKPDTQANVATAVGDIVKETLQMQASHELCTTILLRRGEGRGSESKVLDECLKLLDSTVTLEAALADQEKGLATEEANEAARGKLKLEKIIPLLHGAGARPLPPPAAVNHYTTEYVLPADAARHFLTPPPPTVQPPAPAKKPGGNDKPSGTPPPGSPTQAPPTP